MGKTLEPEQAEEGKAILVSESLFEMLMNCVANLIHIDEVSSDMRVQWLAVAKSTWEEAMQEFNNKRG